MAILMLKRHWIGNLNGDLQIGFILDMHSPGNMSDLWAAAFGKLPLVVNDGKHRCKHYE